MSLKWRAELLFLLITAIVTLLIILPVYLYYGNLYPFYFYNIWFVFLFLLFTRYIFLLRLTPFSHQKMFKLILLFLCIPLFLYFIDGIYEFQRYMDETGFVGISKDDMDEAASMSKYTRYQFLLFGVGTIITFVLLPLRMVVSIWRVTNNKGTV